MPGSSRPIGDRSRILGSILETVLNGIQIIGSIAGTQVDMAEVFQLHARGRTHVTYQRCPLESDQSFADILADRIPARIVFDPGSATTTQ
jgi:alcohol dehydrogenase, propanol-preferring